MLFIVFFRNNTVGICGTLGGGDFRVVEEDQAYTDITSFGDEPQ